MTGRVPVPPCRVDDVVPHPSVGCAHHPLGLVVLDVLERVGGAAEEEPPPTPLAVVVVVAGFAGVAVVVVCRGSGPVADQGVHPLPPPHDLAVEGHDVP